MDTDPLAAANAASQPVVPCPPAYPAEYIQEKYTVRKKSKVMTRGMIARAMRDRLFCSRETGIWNEKVLLLISRALFRTLKPISFSEISFQYHLVT